MESRDTGIKLGTLVMQYVPEKVDLADLQDGCFLLNAEDRKRLIGYLNKNYSRDANVRISKKQLKKAGMPSTYSVVIADGKYQLVYLGSKHRKQAGTGAYGVVKYLQNLETGEFDEVVKITSEHHWVDGAGWIIRPKRSLVENEQRERDHMIMAGMATKRSPIQRRSLAKGAQIIKTQKAAKGMQLDVFFDKNRLVHNFAIQKPAFVLQIFINFALAIEELHNEKKIVHRDIKSENVIVDPGTWHVQLIDFGLSIPIAEAATCNHRVGTAATVAPEIMLQADPPNYGDKTEAFAFGATLAELLGIKQKDTGGFIVTRGAGRRFEPTRLIMRNDRINNNLILSRLYDLCAKLIKSDPRDRLSLADARQELIAIQQLAVEPQRLVAINVADILSGQHLSKLFEYLNLNNTVEIVLLCDDVDAKNPAILQAALEFSRAARSRGYLVHSEALVVPENVNFQGLQNLIANHFKKKEPGINRESICSAYVDKNHQQYLDGLVRLCSVLPELPNREKYIGILADSIKYGISPTTTVRKLKQLVADSSAAVKRGGCLYASVGAGKGGFGKFYQALLGLDLQKPYAESSFETLYDEAVERQVQSASQSKRLR